MKERGKRRGEDKAGVPSHRASENKYAGEELISEDSGWSDHFL